MEASSPELANTMASPTLPDTELEEERNKWVVGTLYEALNARDVETVHRLLIQDIEWWFHGPPSRQHMMRLLTGLDESFVFSPSSIAAFGCLVVVEGSAGTGSVFWVHVWTVGADGIITQVREYFNTSLTVTRLDPVSPPPSASPSTSGSRSSRSCVPLWQSKLARAQAGKSVPGFVLAI